MANRWTNEWRESLQETNQRDEESEETLLEREPNEMAEKRNGQTERREKKQPKRTKKVLVVQATGKWSKEEKEIINWSADREW